MTHCIIHLDLIGDEFCGRCGIAFCSDKGCAIAHNYCGGEIEALGNFAVAAFDAQHVTFSAIRWASL